MTGPLALRFMSPTAHPAPWVAGLGKRLGLRPARTNANFCSTLI